MTIFIVSSVNTDSSDGLTQAVNREVAEADRVALTDRTWLVSFPGTSIELKDKLGISKGAVSGLVSSVPDITGVGPLDLAKWIQDKQTGV